MGGGGVAEALAARDPVEEGERGGRVGGRGGGAEEVGDERRGDGRRQALVGPALVPAARGEDAAELRDHVGGGCGCGGCGCGCGGGGALGEGREAAHGGGV